MLSSPSSFFPLLCIRLSPPRDNCVCRFKFSLVFRTALRVRNPFRGYPFASLFAFVKYRSRNYRHPKFERRAKELEGSCTSSRYSGLFFHARAIFRLFTPPPSCRFSHPVTYSPRALHTSRLLARLARSLPRFSRSFRTYCTKIMSHLLRVSLGTGTRGNYRVAIVISTIARYNHAG